MVVLFLQIFLNVNNRLSPLTKTDDLSNEKIDLFLNPCTFYI